MLGKSIGLIELLKENLKLLKSKSHCRFRNLKNLQKLEQWKIFAL